MYNLIFFLILISSPEQTYTIAVLVADSLLDIVSDIYLLLMFYKRNIGP